MKKRKIIKRAALAICITCSAMMPMLFGMKASVLNLMEMCAFAIWAASDWADREEAIIEEMAQAMNRAYAGGDAPEENQ